MNHHFNTLDGEEISIPIDKHIVLRCYDLPVNIKAPELIVGLHQGKPYIELPELGEHMIYTEKEALAWAALFAEAADELTRLRSAQE